MNLSPQEQAWLDQAKAFPTTFSVPKDGAEDAWGRAQSFVERFASMKLQRATDSVIQTYDPFRARDLYGYFVRRTQMGDQQEIEIQCYAGNVFSARNAETNAHLAAYYIATGDLGCPRCIAR